jgi:23S rRNA pseudoU1915 N3-methylase RlmH
MTFKIIIGKYCKINCLRDDKRFFYHAKILAVTKNHMIFIDRNNKEYIYKLDQILNIEVIEVNEDVWKEKREKASKSD